MKKILVIGCPGSGKSTFARHLRDITGLPLYYLDMIWHKADKSNITESEFDCKLSRILSKDKWIIDGNYKRTLKARLEKCDMVLWLDYPTELCLQSVKSRIGKPREDMPWIETESDPEFFEYIKHFKSEQNPFIENLLKEFSDREIIVFHSREESDKFLRKLKEQKNAEQ
ncbi:MAG: adenylate kinase [Oscillospiraceae bacterium]